MKVILTRFPLYLINSKLRIFLSGALPDKMLLVTIIQNIKIIMLVVALQGLEKDRVPLEPSVGK